MQRPLLMLLALCVPRAGLADEIAASQPAAPAASRPAPISSPPAGLQPEGPAIDVVYTRATRGLPAANSSGDTVLLLWNGLAQRGGAAPFERTGYGAMWLDGPTMTLIDPHDLRFVPLLKTVGKRPAPRVLAEQLQVLESDNIVLFQYPPDPGFDLLEIMEEENRRTGEAPNMRRVTRRLVAFRGPHGKDVWALQPEGRSSAALPGGSPRWYEGWSARGAARLGQRRATYYMLGKAYGAGPQRVRYVAELKQRLGTPLLVSAGAEVTTFSRATGKRHPLRDEDFATLGRLGYQAMLPRARELYYGLAELQQQQRKHKLPLVVTNLYHRSGPKKGQPVFSRYLIRDVNGVRVAILGFVPADLASKVRDPQLLAALEVRDPIKELTRAVTELNALRGSRPRLVIALSALDGEAFNDLLNEAYGVDIVIGGGVIPGRHPPSSTVRADDRPREGLFRRGALLVARGGVNTVGRITARFAGERPTLRLRDLEHRQRTITSEMPMDARAARALMRHVVRAAGRNERVLIPSLEDVIGADTALRELVLEDPELSRWQPREQAERWSQLWYTGQLWGNALTNMLKQATDAEVALVTRFENLSTSTPGPILEAYVQEWLRTEDTVQLYELSGAQLRDVARASQSGKGQVVITGLDLKKGVVEGRALRDDERYRVALGSSVAGRPLVARALAGATAHTRFVREDDRLVAAAAGEPVRLREVALELLRAMRAEDPRFGSAYRAHLRRWLLPEGSEITPRWFLGADDLTVSFANYGNYPSRSWLRNPAMRETRAATPNNYTLGVSGALLAKYDSADIAWETRTDFKLSRVVIDLEALNGQEVSQESSDDLTASTELQLRFIELGLGSARRFKVIPYVNGTFDTEFTPNVNQLTGKELSHQKELRLAAGAVTFPGAILEEIRLAGLLKADFAVPKGTMEGGLLFGTRLSFPLWRAQLKLGGTLRYFPPTASDTIEDLGLVIEGYAKLRVPFTDYLAVSLFADLFAYRAKLDESYYVHDEQQTVSRDLAASLVLGAGLSFDRIWKL